MRELQPNKAHTRPVFDGPHSFARPTFSTRIEKEVGAFRSDTQRQHSSARRLLENRHVQAYTVKRCLQRRMTRFSFLIRDNVPQRRRVILSSGGRQAIRIGLPR